MRFLRKTARGRSEATPARALTLVATVVWGIATVVVAAALLIYFLV
jgi:hypothetical protein